MNIFVGAFEHDDFWYRVATVVSVSAIVVTAVYILRVVGIMLMGPVEKTQFLTLEKVTWFEKLGILLMLLPIIGIGVAPLWISNMILDSLQPFIQVFM